MTGRSAWSLQQVSLPRSNAQTLSVDVVSEGIHTWACTDGIAISKCVINARDGRPIFVDVKPLSRISGLLPGIGPIPFIRADPTGGMRCVTQDIITLLNFTVFDLRNFGAYVDECIAESISSPAIRSPSVRSSMYLQQEHIVGAWKP